ncbi:MAG: hypothetical protein LKE51_13860 [Selenomonas sp.]|nr:hypothetical protein [Selenomonas sp.]
MRRIWPGGRQALMQQEYSLRGGVRMQLTKRIPGRSRSGGRQCGCGRLSCVAWIRLYELGLSEDRLCELGAGSGSDIPFCLRRGNDAGNWPRRGADAAGGYAGDLGSCWRSRASRSQRPGPYQNYDEQGAEQHPDNERIQQEIARWATEKAWPNYCAMCLKVLLLKGML